MRTVMALTLAAALAGCGDRSGAVDFGGEDIGPDLHAIASEDGAVKMGLTREWVYFALSDSARAEAQAELDEDAEADGMEGLFGGIMRRLVGRALSFRAKYAVAEIREIRWEDDRLRIEFNDPTRRVDDNLQLGEGESVTEAFTEEAVRGFAAAFRALNAEPGAQR
jgi:hypothetical protein